MDSTAIAFTIIGLGINAIGLVFLAVQVLLARRQLRHIQRVSEEEARRLKKQSTIDFYMSTAEQLREWREVLPDDWDPEGIKAFVAEVYASRDRKKMSVLASYLAFFEALAAAVSADVYDLEVLDAIAGSRIINISENYIPFFEKRRLEVQAQSAYRELEWLGKKIQNLRLSSPSGYTIDGTDAADVP